MTEPTIAEDDIVICDGPERLGNGHMGLSRPEGPKKVHRIRESELGGDAWALLKELGNPYVTATWPVSYLTKVSD